MRNKTMFLFWLNANAFLVTFQIVVINLFKYKAFQPSYTLTVQIFSFFFFFKEKTSFFIASNIFKLEI